MSDPNPIYVLDYPAMADAEVLWQTAPGPIAAALARTTQVAVSALTSPQPAERG